VANPRGNERQLVVLQHPTGETAGLGARPLWGWGPCCVWPPARMWLA